MEIRDRIKRFVRVPASSVKPSPSNWRTHPTAQADALKGVLAELGFAGAVLVRELPDESLEAIDGHLRLETMGERDVPVLVTDLDEAEAKKLLATYDPIGAMAECNDRALDGLMNSVTFSDKAVNELLDGMRPSLVEGWGHIDRTKPCKNAVVEIMVSVGEVAEWEAMIAAAALPGERLIETLKRGLDAIGVKGSR